MTDPTAPRPRLLRERPLPVVEDAQLDAELRQARRTLVRSPWLARETSPDDFRLVRRHRDALASWFSEALGYHLEVESDTARLRKAALGHDASRPLLRGKSHRPFTPRGYSVLLCTLAALSRARSQLLLDDLARDVRAAAADARVDLDLEAVADRRLLHAALRQLIDMGVLVERDGTVDGWDLDQRIQALLDVRRDRLALLLDIRLGQATTTRELLDTEALPSAAGGARLVARRQLVESPILDVTTLDEGQAQWWRRSRGREAEQLGDWLGLDVELRAEGAVAVDPAGELTDRDFPGPGTVRHAALLVLGRMVDRCRPGALAAQTAQRAWRPVTHTDLQADVADVVAQYGGAFAKEYRDDVDALATEVIAVLTAFGLLRPSELGQAWELHASAARYAPHAVEVTAPTLFDPPTRSDDGGQG
ncbi:MAG: TIGR02678 family protein [Actinomycetes bacterium]